MARRGFKTTQRQGWPATGTRLAALTAALLAALAGACALQPEPSPVRLFSTESAEPLEPGLYTYFLLPGAGSPDARAQQRQRALVEQLSTAAPVPPGVSQRVVHLLVVPTSLPEAAKGVARGATEAAQALRLEHVDPTVSRIYADALACLLPLYPELKQRLLTRPGPFAVTSSPGLNTLAFRNRVSVIRYSPQKLRDMEMHLSMDWMLFVDLSRASADEMRAVARVYQQRLEPMEYYDRDRKLSQLAQAVRNAAPALDADVHPVVVQSLAFMPGMAPGQGCSEYTDVLVDQGDIGLYWRASFLAKSGRPEQALADLDRAIGIDPAFAEAYHSRGGVNIDLGRYEAALADLDRALALDASLVGAHADRAHAYYKLGRYRECVADLDRYLEEQPRDSASYCNRALAQAQLGHFDLAQQDSDQCARLRGGRLDEAFVEAMRRVRERSEKASAVRP